MGAKANLFRSQRTEAQRKKNGYLKKRVGLCPSNDYLSILWKNLITISSYLGTLNHLSIYSNTTTVFIIITIAWKDKIN